MQSHFHAKSWRQTFDPDRDIPNLAEKVILVTGANIGLGRETVFQLAKKNPAQIFLAARDANKAQATIEDIRRSMPDSKLAEITYLPLDLSSFASIANAVRIFHGYGRRLDILINNAGIMAVPPGRTYDGYEIQFGTNHMGHFLLTHLLLPSMLTTAREVPGADVRIINLTSEAISWGPKNGLHLPDCRDEMSNLSPWARYGLSKLANFYFTRELARRYPQIKAIAIHPGAVNTALARGPRESYPALSWLFDLINRYIYTNVQDGALNQLWAATANLQDVKSGALYYPVAREVEGDREVMRDWEKARELWEWSAKEVRRYGYGSEVVP